MEESKVNPTHAFKVEYAIRLGSIEKALILGEIETFSAFKIRHGQKPWVYYSSSAFAEKYPYLSPHSIKRWLKELVEAGELVELVDNKVKYDHTKSYKIPSLSIIDQNSSSAGQNDPSTGQSGPTIPHLTTSTDIARVVKTPRDLPKKKYSEKHSSDSYEDVIDADSREAEVDIPRAKDPVYQAMMKLIYWAEKRRGQKFPSRPKQLKAINQLRMIEIDSFAIADRWKELENDEFFSKNGFDFTSVLSSFNRKSLK